MHARAATERAATWDARAGDEPLPWNRSVCEDVLRAAIFLLCCLKSLLRVETGDSKTHFHDVCLIVRSTRYELTNFASEPAAAGDISFFSFCLFFVLKQTWGFKQTKKLRPPFPFSQLTLTGRRWIIRREASCFLGRRNEKGKLHWSFVASAPPSMFLCRKFLFLSLSAAQTITWPLAAQHRNHIMLQSWIQPVAACLWARQVVFVYRLFLFFLSLC